MKKHLILFAVMLFAAAASCMARPTRGIRRAEPEDLGMDSERLSLIDSTVQASIAAGEIPGAVVGVVRKGCLVYAKAFGYKSLVPEKDTMTVETMFDLASVSKCVGTTTSIMQLVEQGKLRLVDPVSLYIPDFKPWTDPETGKKEEILVVHLLTHSSGLDPYVTNMAKYLEEYGPHSTEKLLDYICNKTKRNFKPGTRQMYSCLNFVTLQCILQTITGKRLCDYAQENIFTPLGMNHTTYFPLDGSPVKEDLAALCAPTEVQPDGSVLKAAVHDPIARLCNDGNSGNAGVFSNVEDLALFSACLLSGGSYNGIRILSPLTVQKMFLEPTTNEPEVARALGWDTYHDGPYTSGCIFNPLMVRGHTGYTGTSIILDLETNTAVIVLAHRVHPKDEGSTSRLRSTVASIAASSIVDFRKY